MKITFLKLSSVLIVLFFIISCSSSINSGSWEGSAVIAGVGFNYSFETKSNNTYKLTGNAGGIDVNESGSFDKVSEKEIRITSGKFAGSKFIKSDDGLDFYLDTGDYFMTLK